MKQRIDPEELVYWLLNWTYRENPRTWMAMFKSIYTEIVKVKVKLILTCPQGLTARQEVLPPPQEGTPGWCSASEATPPWQWKIVQFSNYLSQLWCIFSADPNFKQRPISLNSSLLVMKVHLQYLLDHKKYGNQLETYCSIEQRVTKSYFSIGLDDDKAMISSNSGCSIWSNRDCPNAISSDVGICHFIPRLSISPGMAQSYKYNKFGHITSL